MRASIYPAGQGGLDVASLARRSHADALTGEAGGGVTISMAEYSNDRRKVRHDLEIARTKLFEQFLKHPQDARLVLAVKLIDGQIASCSEWIRTKERGAEKEYQKLLH